MLSSSPEGLAVTIDPNGVMSFVYADELAGLVELGQAVVTRVSHVEPAAGGGWTADMVGGPVLGPFKLRGEALGAERDWLRENRGL